MSSRYNWDHQYFQQMIEREDQINTQRAIDRTNQWKNAEFFGAIIINMPKLVGNSSDDESMLGLQD